MKPDTNMIFKIPKDFYKFLMWFLGIAGTIALTIMTIMFNGYLNHQEAFNQQMLTKLDIIIAQQSKQDIEIDRNTIKNKEQDLGLKNLANAIKAVR